MTRRRSSPLGLELVVSVVLALVLLPLLSHGAPVQDSHGDLQRYSEGCYYNYNHYSEGDRILTNEPCLNCTCHNKMLMCYLRVCPFTKPIGQDCTVEKRADQCCPIITCPEVPVDVSHHNNQLTTNSPGTELSIPEKYGCSIDSKFYPEGAQVPSNPNKPCELCYCIRNRTSCLMQECTLHIDGCQPIYNKGSCCPVRYSCDHENELLELEDHSTTTTTVRPTPGYILTSTMTPPVSTDCVHNGNLYADGASITGKNACEHCYCMRGDIVCAVQECEMPTLESGAKTCRALPPAEGECCPSNYVCDDDTVTTEVPLLEELLTTIASKIDSDLHGSVSEEDVQLQEHIDDKIAATEVPDKSAEHVTVEEGSGQLLDTTAAQHESEATESSEEDKKTEEEEEDASPLMTTVSALKETSYETTQASIEQTSTHKTEDGFVDSHISIGQDNDYDSTQAPIEDEIINEDKKEIGTTVAPVTEGIQKVEDEVLPSNVQTTALDESTTASPESSSEEGEIENEEAVELSNPVESTAAEEHKPIVEMDATTTTSIEKLDEEEIATSVPRKEEVGVSSTTQSSAPSKSHIALPVEEEEESSSAVPSEQVPDEQIDSQDKIDKGSDEPSTSTESATTSPSYEMVTEGEDSHILMPEIGDHKTVDVLHDTKPKDEEDITTGAPESDVSDIDDIMKHDDLPAITEDNIVTKAPYITDQETESKPVTIETEEASTATQDLDEVITSRPAIEDLQGPVEQEDEIPAIVEAITEISTKPDLQAIHVEESTALPEKDSSLEDASESEEEDFVTTVSPSKVLVAGTATDQFIIDSTTMAASTTDNEATIIKEDHITGHLESGIADSTTTAPSAHDSAAPSSEGVSKVQQDTADSTTSVPSIEDIEASGSDEEDHVTLEETTSSPTMTSHVNNYTTVIPSIIGETVSEDDLSNADSTTIAPSTAELEEIKGHPEQTADGTTIPSSAVDSQASISEDEIEGQKDITADSTTTVPSVDDSETPVSEEEIKIDSEQTVAPTIISTFAPDSDEASNKQPEQTADLTTIAPSTDEYDKEIKGQPEQTPDYTTIAPSTTESDEEIKKHPVLTADYTTIAPSTAESDEEIKGYPGHTADSTTYPPSGPESDEEIIEQPGETVDSTTATSGEKIKEQPEQTADSTTTSPLPAQTDEEIEEHQEQTTYSPTYAPSLSESVEDLKGEPEHTPDSTSSTESNQEIKGQPEQTADFTTTTTIASVAADSEAFKEQPGQTTGYSTIAPSISESSEEIEGQPERPTDFTTVASIAADSELTSAEEEIKVRPEATTDSSTNASITADTDEEIKKQPEEINNASASDGSESTIAEEEIIGQTEHTADSSTNASVAVEDDEELKKKPEQTTAASASDGSESTSVEEEIKQQSEQTADSTTNASMAAGTDEEIKEQPEQTTTTAVSADSEITSIEDEIKVQSEEIADSTTIPSVAADTEAPNAEEENKEQPEKTADSTTISSSPSNIKEGIKGQPEQTSDYVTIAPSTVSEDSVKGHLEQTGADAEATNAVDETKEEPEKTSEYTTSTPEHSSDETEQEDILHTTLSPIASADEQSSEVIEDTEGSGEQMQEIIPSAIPGEGDCLVNDKTFVNNATVPTSNECELSCSCISSVVVCEKVKCYEPPKPNNCVLDQASTDRCCPQYICGVDSFAEDQQPTTPEDIEEEEIQFTTLAPTKKYPEQSTSEQESIEPTASTVVAITESEENATGKPEENPTKSAQDESTKTDEPTLVDQMSTPSSIDIEMPVITPEEPMSNVKEEEESTEKLFSIESSTQVPQLLDEIILPAVTVKPTLIVTGDIEEPVKATTVPYISASSMKPSTEGSTNANPTQEASTEAAFGVEITTIKLSNMDAPSLSSVLESESTESEEIAEVTEQSSNESGLESEEDSQQQVFPTVGGEITPDEDTTIQHEGDYQKPEMPEDMSHIKVDETESAENQESEESTENVFEEVTTPPKASGSTVLTPVEHSDEYPHKIDNIPEISDKKDEFQVTDSSVPEQSLGTLDNSTESQPISSTTPTATEEDESLPATIAPVFNIEKGETQTSAPVVGEQPISETAVSGENSEEKKDQIEIHTNAPSSEEQSIAGTISPLSEQDSEEKIDHIKTETSAPGLDEKPTEATVSSVSGDVSEENIDEEQAIAGTVSPISEEGSDENKDHLEAQTSTPAFEEQPIVITVAPVSEDVSDEETDEIPAHTSSPAHEETPTTVTVAPISESESEEKKDKVDAHTSAPAYDEQPIAGTVAPMLAAESDEQAIAGTVASISAEDSDENKDQVEAHTGGPVHFEQPIEVTVSQGSGEDSGEMTDEVPATSVPTYEENSIAATIAPVLDEESEEAHTTVSSLEEKPIAVTIATVSGEESEENKDLIETQTIAPVVEEKPISGTIVPLSEEFEDNKYQIETQTSAPEHPVAVTDTPNSQVEEDEITSHSTVPTVEEQTTSLLENEKEDIDSQTSAPVIAEQPLTGTDASSENESEEDIASHTDGPISPSTSSPTSHEADVSSSTTSRYEEEEIIAETDKPITEDKKPSVQAPHEDQESEADFITAATPVKAVEIEGQSDITESPAASTTIKAVDTSSDLDTTEVPLVDLSTEIVYSPESSEGTNAPTLSEESTVAPSHIDVSDSKNDKVEGSTQTPASIEDDSTQSMIDIDSEENINSELPSEESSSVTKVSEDKTLLQTETPTYETVHPADEESITEGKPATELPSAQTDKPDENESSTEDESLIESSKVTVVPEVIAMEEITSQPGKPVSDDQVSIDDESAETVKPISDEITAPTESSLDENAPEVDDKLSSTEGAEKPVPTTTTQTDKPIPATVQKDSEISSDGSVTETQVTQTDRPISVPSVHKDEGEYSTVVPVSHDQDTTGKPIEDISTQSVSEEDEHDIAFTTTHSLDVAQTNAPSTSEAPISPVGSESSIASSEEESEEESIQTEAPKDDVKIQTIAEFVTERVDELTTALPVLDTLQETSTSSPDEEKEEEYEATTDKIAATPIRQESVETTPVHEIPAVIAEEHPTESAIPSSEKPSAHVEDRFDIDLPKPMVTDEETIGEEETPLATTVHPLFPHIDLDITTSRPAHNASDKIDDEVHVTESAAPSTSASSSTLAPTTEQSSGAQSVTSAPTSQYQPPGYGHAPPQYPSYPEDEYTDEDETEVFGPGTCRYGGKLFVSAQQIPRDDPCDFCFCFRSDIICLQQSCPPPISGCHEEPISGFCCPRYECPVSMATVLNITTSTTTTSTTLPPHFLHHAYRGAAEKNGCHINGKSYKVGDQIESASGPCMHCTCGGDGQMKCDPKTCSPEPMLRQMIAVVASRRR